MTMYNYNYILNLTTEPTLKLIFTYMASTPFKTKDPISYLSNNLNIDLSHLNRDEILQYFMKGTNMFPLTKPYNYASLAVIANKELSVQDRVGYIRLASLISPTQRYEFKLGIKKHIELPATYIRFEDFSLLNFVYTSNYLEIIGTQLRFIQEEKETI